MLVALAVESGREVFMRLSEGKIKAGILHPEQYVRDAAMSYFSSSLSDDRTIMPVAIDAVETYGWADAFADIETLQPLAQSDPTVSWLVGEFNRLSDTQDRRAWEYLTSLSWILAEADAGLLKRRRKDVLGVPLLDADARETITERTRLLTASASICWNELEDFCRRVASGQSAGLTLARAFHLVEAIARHERESTDRVLEILLPKGSAANDLSSRWLQLFMIRAAGQMRLADAIPAIVETLQQENEEWVHEECVLALTRIGGDAVAKAVWNACAVGGPHFVTYAAWVLESIHSDVAEEAALYLFEREEDRTAKLNLGHALLADFAIDGLPPVRHFVLNSEMDEETVELRNGLLAVCTLMEAQLPELIAWREELQQDEQYRSTWQSPEFPVVDTWSTQLATPPDPKRDELPMPPPRRKVPKGHVGRNDPCPCNSGKKYKNCCLRPPH